MGRWHPRNPCIGLLTPVVFVVVGVIGVVRAVRAVKPWRAYVAATPAAQRRRDRARDLQGGAAWQYWLFGVAALGGFVALAAVFVVLPDGGIRVPGIILWFEFEVLLAMTAAGCLVLAVRTARARHVLARAPHPERGWVRTGW